jgi:hypothetical protein
MTAPHYIICFKSTGHPHWWNRFLHPRALHVFAVKWTGKHWVMVHPRIAYLEVQVLDYTREEDLLKFIKAECIEGICRVDFNHLDTERIRVPWIFGLWTCVSQVKALLGIRAPWILTPRQLYRYLRYGSRRRR